ncbi:non-ribosomal peptide synthetase [Marinomonas transparens]|uniref:Amino acid adenylation domain-containing protein n=1 Tax=Marinomonas transparens TaxID=2795388 RepID=A0A934MV33_9GAMM|nr:non-ribosomal peptide synthetase [Marinomonas transparens]MBJ7536589.1 amino acid adenylation domain-containing protein [Marinomonas transparens]
MNIAQRQLLLKRLAKSRGLDVSTHLDPSRNIPHLENTLSVPLSHAQERMWFLHQLDPSSSAYNVCVLWHFKGPLDHKALKESAVRISMQHSIFRTLYYTNDEGNSRQKIVPSLPPEWHTEDLRKYEKKEQNEKLNAIAQKASTDPFDLTQKSGLRLILTALDDDYHVLVMIGQHIAWDGPSFGIFSNELAHGYTLSLKNDTPNQSSTPLQYVDFANWHRQQWQTNTEKRETALAFWQKELSPLPEKLDFPTDFVRTAGNDESGGWCSTNLDKTTTASLQKLCAEEQVTPFEILITTIAILITRLARASEITIGTVASHRNMPELNDVIGNFGNVVPIRLKVSPSFSFRQQLQQCAKVCRVAFSNSDIPFEHLLEQLDVPRGESSNPLLDTMVTFLAHGMKPPEMDGLNVEWRKHFNGTTQTDLSFDALLQNDCLQIQATWRKSLFHADTIPKHLQRLANLLRTFANTPDQTIAAESLLLKEEYSQLIDSWGHRPALSKKAPTVIDWFENIVNEKPKDIAVYQTRALKKQDKKDATKPEEKLDFETLNARANALARWLIKQNIGPEKQIAICLPREKDWFVAMLAILKAGASFIPIDPNYPSDYIDRVVRLAEPSFIFINKQASTESALTDAITQQSGKLVDLHTAEAAAMEEGLSNTNVLDNERLEKLLPEHPVYTVFTSGSSGQPKGVVIPHSALANLLSSHKQDLYEAAIKRTGRSTLRVGHAWSLAFDASWQPNLWMFEGHELHLFDTDVMQDPIALAQEIIQRKLDFIELTPGMLDEVLPWLESGVTLPSGEYLAGHIPALLGFGGEAVKAQLWQKMIDLEQTTGFNLYGPTETTVDTMIARAEPNKSPSIGMPIWGAHAYVLDKSMQLAPPGIPGELTISGEGLARGYLGRGDLTASHFVANPYGAPGSRLYRTGDRVRWLQDGMMEYIGRIDEQIKIRGFRVEPLEVEASVERIIQLPCAIVVKKHNNKVQLLCFYELSNQTNEADISQSLQNKCASSLPDHLMPKHFMGIEKLPRLPNGKIDRRSLPDITLSDSHIGREPSTELEHTLCALFADVLGLKKIGVDDSFFELGGDSISVIRLVSLARRKNMLLSARQVFTARSVAKIALELEQSNTTKLKTPNQTSNNKNDKANQLAKQMGLPLHSLLPVLLATAGVSTGLIATNKQGNVNLKIQQTKCLSTQNDQALSIMLSKLGTEFTHSKQLSAKIRDWCWQIARSEFGINLEDQAATHTINREQTHDFEFRFLNPFATADEAETELNQRHQQVSTDTNNTMVSIFAYNLQEDPEQKLHFAAFTESSKISDSALNKLLAEYQRVIQLLSTAADQEASLTDLLPANSSTKITTPLQRKMVLNCDDENDPWTIQLELTLTSSLDSKHVETTLERNTRHLLNKHDVLRSGYFNNGEKTFIAEDLQPDWQYEDWSHLTKADQNKKINAFREEWESYRFTLHQPPLIRFMLIRLTNGDLLTGNEWLLFINSHHLLLDGWSTPRLLHELLNDADDIDAQVAPTLAWADYLSWLQEQDKSQSWLYWNRELDSIKTPSVIAPERQSRTPTQDISEVLSSSKNTSLIATANKINTPQAALFQLAWARTISTSLAQKDVVFGLFDSGRALNLEGIESLVGMLVQVVPIRINTADKTPISEQLKELQTKKFEWQSLVPIHLDHLTATEKHGEFFDTLLVIENALEGDAEITRASPNAKQQTTTVAKITNQRWRDSIAQSLGLFVYPGKELTLRLCYDPIALNHQFAQEVLLSFKTHLDDITQEINAETTSKDESTTPRITTP